MKIEEDFNRVLSKVANHRMKDFFKALHSAKTKEERHRIIKQFNASLLSKEPETKE